MERPITFGAELETLKNLATINTQLLFQSPFQVSSTLSTLLPCFFFSKSTWSLPIFLGWWDVSKETRRCSTAMKVKMESILDKMISIRPDLHRSSFEVGGNDCTLNTKRRKPPTFKQLFSGNTKLHKNLRRYYIIIARDFIFCV